MRQIKIVGYMIRHGAAYGAIAGGVAGAIVGLLLFVIGALVGIPTGIIVGLGIGAIVGLACGIVTICFDLYSRRITSIYRVCLAIVSMLLTPILVVSAWTQNFPSVKSGGASNILSILGVLLAIPMSQRLVKVYRKFLMEHPAPAA